MVGAGVVLGLLRWRTLGAASVAGAVVPVGSRVRGGSLGSAGGEGRRGGEGQEMTTTHGVSVP